MTDSELNRLFAEVVAGWEFHGSRDAYVGGVLQAVPEYWTDPEGDRHFEDWPFPDYCYDADAVLERLEGMTWSASNCEEHNFTPIDGMQVWVGERGGSSMVGAEAPTFAKAAVLALLRARGVEVAGE